MAVMTVSEARAALPEVLTRVAQGEEITITRFGSPVAVVVRPDVVWSQPGAEVIMDETQGLVCPAATDPSHHGAHAGDFLVVEGGNLWRPGSLTWPPFPAG